MDVTIKFRGLTLEIDADYYDGAAYQPDESAVDINQITYGGQDVTFLMCSDLAQEIESATLEACAEKAKAAATEAWVELLAA